jgi:hypothetical protein
MNSYIRVYYTILYSSLSLSLSLSLHSYILVAFALCVMLSERWGLERRRKIRGCVNLRQDTSASASFYFCSFFFLRGEQRSVVLSLLFSLSLSLSLSLSVFLTCFSSGGDPFRQISHACAEPFCKAQVPHFFIRIKTSPLFIRIKGYSRAEVRTERGRKRWGPDALSASGECWCWHFGQVLMIADDSDVVLRAASWWSSPVSGERTDHSGCRTDRVWFQDQGWEICVPYGDGIVWDNACMLWEFREFR